MKNQINLFRYPKFIEIIRYLYLNKDKNRVVDISFYCGITYSYISINVKVLKSLGLITNQVKGRENFISLTEKGLNVSKRINEIMEILK